jgi:hypothetical protein
LGENSPNLVTLAVAQEWPKPDLNSNVFKPAKTQAQSMKPEPVPSPQKSSPTHRSSGLRTFTNYSQTLQNLLVIS